MVMNLILVFLVCECNEYVIPKSMSRKDLGYKSMILSQGLKHTVPVTVTRSRSRLGVGETGPGTLKVWPDSGI